MSDNLAAAGGCHAFGCTLNISNCQEFPHGAQLDLGGADSNVQAGEPQNAGDCDIWAEI